MKVYRLFTFLMVVVLALANFAVARPAQATDPDTFYGGFPYSVPPKGHLNSFIPDGIPNGIGLYHDLLEPAAALYVWANGTYRGLIAESWGFEGADKYVLKLKAGGKWSDGNPITARDVVATYAIGRLRNFAEYTYVDKVTARDELTVEFALKTPSTLVERLILRTRIRSAATYGAIADKVEAFVAAGKDRANADKAEWDALVKEITDFRPEKLISSGPYTLDLADVTDSQLTMRRNELSQFPAKFAKVVLYNGETEAVTPLFLNKEMYYGTYFFPPATEAALIEAGFEILRSPTYAGPGLFFNFEVPAFQKVEFRQAVAHAINRKDTAVASYGEKSGFVPQYITGVSDNLIKQWVSEDVLNSLNKYEYDLERAAKLMEAAGYTKDGDVWKDSSGAALEFELLVPSDFTDWVPAGENAAEQLTAFGIKTTLRGVPRAQQVEDVKAGKFQMVILLWGFPNPHPFYAYRNMYVTNTVGRSADQKGLSFPMVQTIDGKEYDFNKLIAASGAGADLEAQKAVVTELVTTFNKLVPAVPLVERLGNTPLLTSALSGVPPLDDPLYQNAFSADSYIALWILDGTLGPKQ